MEETSSNTAIASGSGYGGNTENVIDYRTKGYFDKFCLTPGSTYTLEVSDSYGDGMCCNGGEGSFSGLIDGVEIFSNDGEFDTSTIQTFTVQDDSPSEFPTSSPTDSSTESPVIMASDSPTGSPTDSPVIMASDSPTGSPTSAPTSAPSNVPSTSPTTSPTASPAASPAASPTVIKDVCADKDRFRWNGREDRDCQWVGRKRINILKKWCNRVVKIGRKKKRLHEWCPTTCATVDLGACTE